MQLPQDGADTSNFDVHAKGIESNEWILVGRLSWWINADHLPLYEVPEPGTLSYSSFAMPTSEEVIVFEPFIMDKLDWFPSPLFGYGLGMILFAAMAFFNLHDWAAASMSVGCAISIFLEIMLGQERRITNFRNYNITWNQAVFAFGLGRSVSLFLASFLLLVNFDNSNKVTPFAPAT